jgi:2-hydroxy-3-keto-5-methylthiopentenyl-1-phosphate phosphatase
VKTDRDETVTNALAPEATLVLDFDGTITEIDLLDEIAERFGDPGVYREVEEGLLSGAITLRECITREFAPVRAPLADVTEWALQNIRIRAGFRAAIDLANDRGWPVLILSSGFHELIEPLLEREGVQVEVKANRLDPDPTGWRVLWRDETVCPVCGQPCKRGSLPPEGDVIYVGDGYSDRCAALAANRIFATRGLARYLADYGVHYEPFQDFHDVLKALAA